MAKKQRDAVVEAVITVLGDSFVPGETIVSDINLDTLKGFKKQIRQIVLDGFLNGEIECKKDLSDSKEANKYTNNVVDNYIRRAKELNAGTSYEPTKEGTKRDPKLKALNALISTGTVEEGSDDYTSVVQSITKRKEEIAAERGTRSSSKAAIIIDDLPPGLQDIARGKTFS